VSTELARTTASVVIATHSEERWEMLLRALESAAAQEPAPVQVIVAVDHNAALCRRLEGLQRGIKVVDHQGVPGASGARNAGVQHATAPVIAFLDDDVEARAGWLRELLQPFGDPRVVGTGGMTLARWQAGRPRWFPDEFGWVVGASYTGLPTDVAPLRNVWSENMAVRRELFEAVGGFRPDFGKGRASFSSREDTEVCIRVAAPVPGGRWLYVPTAVIDHEVPPDRSTFAFFLRRTYTEGLGKMEMRGHLGAGSDLTTERDYLLRVLPAGFVRALLGREFARAGALAGGAAAAAVGVARGWLRGAAVVLARSSR
jgi:GT2 family glycosyltransferase